MNHRLFAYADSVAIEARPSSVRDFVASGGRSVSFEFFPPSTDAGEDHLWAALNDLEQLNPTFASVTYGAAGTTRDRTIRLTQRIAKETSMTPVGHLTCVGASVDELRRVLDDYQAAGVEHILALRGDPPAGRADWVPHPGGLSHADQLVRLAVEHGDFVIGVAAFPEGHPESVSLEVDARVLLAKQEAGADFAVTQFFFRPEDYFRLTERLEEVGCDLPVIPGIMPVTNVAQIERFAALSGAEFPPEIAERLHAVADDSDQVLQLGIELATELGRALLDGGAPGLHFFTLNRSRSTHAVHDALREYFTSPLPAG